MNIKNPETHQLAQELATRLKTTVTGAVTIALEEYLATHTGTQGDLDRIEKLRVISQRAAERVRATTGTDPQAAVADLYDSRGLPR